MCVLFIDPSHRVIREHKEPSRYSTIATRADEARMIADAF